MEAYLVAIAIVALIYVLLALGLTLQYGFTGLINFGHVGFFAIGAYTSAILAMSGVPLVLSFAAGTIVAGLAAWPIGLIALRLRDDYFAIVTLGFSETVRLVITSEKWLTNGVQGIPAIPRMFASISVGSLASFAVLAVLLVVTIIAVLGMGRIVKSPFGRIIEAIRDNEDAVKALGKDPARFKVQVLILGSGLAGLAGAFYAHYITYIVPDQFIPLVTFYVWMAIIIGGVGRVSGAVVGTVLLMVLLEGSRFIRDVMPFISDVEMASVRLGVIGLLLILFTIYRPQGLMGDFTRR
ncbi:MULTISPECIES: branched-chain amino acid ABC transporter permease [unclassified Chelatococcus]|jgi:branched-chain amino acid transport system permease protein|uniref:branched-chain amino acid ABC transporter permease n=1 Tax=unclassified Chelatococcus TaxID=2638111 RepID=UPI001BCF921B|nr:MULTISPECIES: branched-chain amino acid ABC transporter permease [unclassified Chelatococcus]CAH1661396.1 Amino acid/amide ABC transporter membrane protein 2 (HAAT family) [Hyphomicrobiales bacterium]MBS7741249.1 branched-chain amino acid ABC transporter permease [Chelatococcus sp. HY11]MBX3546269.1 branched-chain amino acid ABC transporter permease [Chelatococcus sp.]MCO5078072.1 branched-chain amino acid ABC transporter permease [Chelatococcus sp.]CAH1683114.1 Amino acid/amide ABC transpo